MSAPVETIEVKSSEAGVRLDRWFKLHFPEVGYAYLQKLLRTGQIRVDSRRVEANARLEAGAHIRVPKIVREEKKKAAPTVKPPLGGWIVQRSFPRAGSARSRSSDCPSGPGILRVIRRGTSLAGKR